MKEQECIVLTFNGKSMPPTKTLYFDMVSLEEGVNYVPVNVFKKRLKDNPAFQLGMKEGYLNIVKEEQETKKNTQSSRKKKEATINITKLNLKEAQQVASSETSKALLAKWLEAEKSAQNRKEVIALLQANLEKSK